MANTVTSQTLVDDTERCVIKFTNESDGTAETAVKKVDVSTLTSKNGDACSEVIIEKIVADISGCTIKMLWDATANVFCHSINASGSQDFVTGTVCKGIENNAGAGKTGDLLFTTAGLASGDYYSVILYMRKVF